MTSEEIYQIFGNKLDNDLNHTFKLIHPKDHDEIEKAKEKYYAGEPFEIEFRIPQQNGAEKFVIGKGEPEFDKEGQIISVQGTLQDITEKKRLEEELKRSNKNLSDAQVLAQIGSWEMDLVHNRLYCSDEAIKIIGVNPEEFENTYEGFIKMVHPEDVVVIKNLLKNPSKKPVELEFRIIRPDGFERNIFEIIEFIFNEKNEPIYLYGTIQDITEKKELEKALKYKHKELKKVHRRYKKLIEESNDVFEIIKPDGTIVYISDAVERVIGTKPEERIGKNLFDFYKGKDLEKLKKIVQLVLKFPDKKYQKDITFKTNSGKEIILEATMKNLLDDPAIQGIVIAFRDISGRVDMAKRLAFIASHDKLTKLPNRFYFNTYLKIQCSRAKKENTMFAVMILDIDGFKYINDALGYQIGDELIKAYTKRLKSFLGDGVTICRYAGDRCAIFLPDFNTLEECEKIAGNIRRLLLQTFKIGIYELNVSTSMGISIYPEDGRDAESLLNYANIALLRAKNEGKNKYKFYSSDLNIISYKQFELRNDLRDTIKKGQLEIYYQPIVNLKTSKVIAAEALIRWEHPNWGIISPKEFISLAEETGFIIGMGKWVLRQVCHNYKQWLSNGLPETKVSVNFSVIQFFEKDFVKNIINIINEFDLDPHFLIMEITESVLIENTDKVNSDLQKLQSYGIQIALDDFGTGFSSLAYLKNFNIDILKIDGSFIKNINNNETSSVISKFIIDMARELKIKIIAEGIENREQLSALRELNCDNGQGYLYSKPVPLGEFEKILAKKKCKPFLAKTFSKKIKNRRKYFRIKFQHFLEANMTILEIKGQKVNVGNTKVLIANIGPGGLNFISNIKLPLKKEFILQFTTELAGNELKVFGYPVWTEPIDENLNEYGLEFTIDENYRSDITKILNDVQIKMRNNPLFADGSFVSLSSEAYFKLLDII